MTNWPAITVALVSLAGTVSVAGAQFVGSRASREQTNSADWKSFTDALLRVMSRVDGNVSEVHDQVTNGGTNLRIELDAFRSEIRDGIKLLHRDIGGMREELRVERSERIKGDRLRRGAK